jgi:hypothetical protein
MARSSRIEIARRRVTIVRYSVGITAAAAFAVFAFAARAAHPGTRSGNVSTPTDSSAAVTSSDDAYRDVESSDSFGFGSSSVSPSYDQAPSVQSAGS